MPKQDAAAAALAFRDAMARLPAAVHIITTDGPAGRAGLTASAVTSVTDAPPTLLVCLNRASSVYDTFRRNEVLCVNTLGPHHEALSRLFGGRTPMAERFAAAGWSPGLTAAPVLDRAVVSFECRVVKTVEFETHDVFFCEVLAIANRADLHAAVYVDREYRTAPGRLQNQATELSGARPDGLRSADSRPKGVA